MPNLLLLALLATFPALSTDMYLPAIPTLQTIWGISLVEVNVSLVAFFLSFSGFLLIHGPLSDRVGRKPVLLGGIAIFIIGCLLCSTAQSITWLVAARIIQAAGAAAAFTLSLALSKDLYEGPERQKILAWVGVILALSPMLAPTLGSWLLLVASWRWIFVCQAVLAVISLYGSFKLEEPLKVKTRGGVFAVASRYFILLKNTRYVVYTLSFSLMTLGHFAFVGGSPDIFITGYGVSAQAFGYYFGLNALGLMFGSFTCSRFCGGLNPLQILTISLLGMLVAATFLTIEGGSSPIWFVGPMLVMSYLLGLSRPISNNMILEEVDQDVGTASSFLTFTIFIIGAMSMQFIAFDWSNKPAMIGKLALIGVSIPLITMWAMNFISRKRALNKNI
ncbi:MAG: multidrug transporter CflA [Desulfovibrio sp. S3730MH75]|nr:MAG: multidrug transporter CflA [Desulfovibrio sp. S3730MH75]